MLQSECLWDDEFAWIGELAPELGALIPTREFGA